MSSDTPVDFVSLEALFLLPLPTEANYEQRKKDSLELLAMEKKTMNKYEQSLAYIKAAIAEAKAADLQAENEGAITFARPQDAAATPPSRVSRAATPLSGVMQFPNRNPKASSASFTREIDAFSEVRVDVRIAHPRMDHPSSVAVA